MISSEANLFLRVEDESADDELKEKWDDRELIRVYDKAMSEVKRKILKKIQKEDGLTNEEVEGLISGDDISGSPVSKPKKSKKGKKRISKSTDWCIGDACRAIYSEDGEEYEAEIVKKIDGNWCVVKFIGYNNEEEVLFKELMPSMGKKVRKIQLEMADNEKRCKKEEEMETEEDEDDSSSEIKLKPKFDTKPFKRARGVDPNTFFPSTFLPPSFQRPSSFCLPASPPPPPIPPGMINGWNPMLPSFPRHRSKDVNLDSLLMSWYLCGYYTGYYAREMKN